MYMYVIGFKMLLNKEAARKNPFIFSTKLMFMSLVFFLQ